MGARTLSADEKLEYGNGWRVKGTTDDVSTCEHCGRRNLKRTVAMVPLDADGNEDGDAAYFGTGCAVGYIKAGTLRGKPSGAKVWEAARVADRLRVERRRWAGEILAKYGHVRDFDPIQKRAIYDSYNPGNGARWDGAQEIDRLLSEADAEMADVPADVRAQYIALGRKVLGLDERP